MSILSSTIESPQVIDSDSIDLDEEQLEGLSLDPSVDVSRVFGSFGKGSSVDSLLRCAKGVKSLTAAEEKQLIKLAQQGDIQSRNYVVMANINLVGSLARRYRNRGLPMVDLMQDGIIGLINAVGKFDLDKGLRFSTYGAWWVREAMTRALSNKSRTVRIPVHMNEFMTKLRRIRAELSLDLGRKPSEEEMALSLGVTVEKVRKTLAYTQQSVSLDQPVSNREGEECTLIDLTADDETPSPDSQADDDFVRKQVSDLLEGLSKRERQVIRKRFGFGSGAERSLLEVSQELGLTRDQVGKASCKAMRKLKVTAREQGLQTIIA